MAQIKIFARRETIARYRTALSEAIHTAVMQALAYPAEKRFHRFIGLEAEDFLYPDDRSESYLIVEISMFEGRSTEAKKALIRAIFANVIAATGIAAQDVEITILDAAAELGDQGRAGRRAATRVPRRGMSIRRGVDAISASKILLSARARRR